MFTNTAGARTFSFCPFLRIFGLAAATMLLLLLLHLLLHQILNAKDAFPIRDVGYIIELIDSCPQRGFYFKRDTIPNAVEELCFLCFCQDDNTAVCWRRENRKCDAGSYFTQKDKGVSHKRHETRIRRSPGFADIFFRDATRDVFQKNSEVQCKPFESSFSDDCPPADWCTGCTVCDCDANGRWDCHLLSFCPDKNKRAKQNKNKSKNDSRKIVSKKRAKPTKPKQKPKRSPKATPKAVPKKQPVNKIKVKPTKKAYGGNMTKVNNKRDVQKQMRWNPNNKGQKRIFKKSVPVNMPPLIGNPNLIAIARNKATNKILYKRLANTKSSSKEKFIKKNVATHSPIDLRQKVNINLEKEIARTLMRRVMGNMKNTMDDMAYEFSRNLKKNLPKPNSTKGKKRQTNPQKKPVKATYKKPYRKPTKKPYKLPNKNLTKYPKKSPPKKYEGRRKRDLNVVGLTPVTAEAAFTTVTFGNHTNSKSSISLTPPTTISLISANKVLNFTKRYNEDKNVTGSEYYKYTTIDETNSSIKRNTESKVTQHTNIISPNKNTLTVLNLMGTEFLPTTFTEITLPIPNKTSKLNKPKRDDSTKIDMLPVINPEENDIKFSKWPTLKVSQEAELTAGAEKHKTVMKVITPINKTDFDNFKKRVYGKDVEKSLWTKMHNRRRGIIKLLPLTKAVPSRPVYNNITTAMHTTTSTKTTGALNKMRFLPKVEELQKFLAKIMKDLTKRNVTQATTSNRYKIKNHKKKAKKVNVVRYLKRIFNKLFRSKTTSKEFKNHQIIETLCETFGPCNIRPKDKPLLKTKLTKLDAETKKILRLVKIIKGLLNLVDLPPLVDRKISKKEHLHTEIKKLNDILKGDYSKSNNTPLTTAQITQIDYIKKNTHEFIKSVSKFASLLNDIINILRKGNKHHYSRKSGKRTMRHIPNTNQNLIQEHPFQDLKLMIEKYNLVQNKFIKQMYDQISNFERALKENPKVSQVQYLNNTVAIEKFSKNIIENLRKLKRLAQTLSSNGRQKREVPRDDDAIEYLLMLMEYLLKQQHPLDAAPVNDGIDLLIDAIKSAPDIKPIQKKVLKYTPASNSGVVITTPLAVFVNTEPPVDDDSPSESEKASSEDMSRPKLVETENTVKQKIEEHKETLDILPEDDKIDLEDKYPVDRRAGMEDITEIAYYKRLEDNIVEADNGYETSTSQTPEPEIGEKMIDREEPLAIAIKRSKIVENNNNLAKPMVEGGVDERKFEVFNGDMEDEMSIPGGIVIPSTEVSTIVPDNPKVTTKKPKSKMRHLNLESFDSESIDKKSKLEWIEENFGKESERDFRDMEENNTAVVSVTVKTTPTSTTTARQDVSAVSRELTEEEKKRKAKLNAEEVMFRKQMDLLNSLDYGTEKVEIEDSDSKDGNVDTSDNFPSYFV